MKITELIAKLQKIKAKHGDIDAIALNNNEPSPVEREPALHYYEVGCGDKARMVCLL